MFSWICAWINGWVNNREAGDLRRHHSRQRRGGTTSRALLIQLLRRFVVTRTIISRRGRPGGGTWRLTRLWRRSVGVLKSGAASRSRKCMAMPVNLPGLHTTLQWSMQSGLSGLQSRTRLRLNMPTLIPRALRSTAWQSRCDVRTRTFVVKCLSVNNQGELFLDDSERMKAWVEHYKGLLNVKLRWDEGALPDAGPSGIIVEMLKAAGSKGIDFLRKLIKSVVKHDKIPEDWEMSFILNLYKGKGDTLNRGNYGGLKLTEHAMKVMERIVDGMIREMIAIDEMQFAFVPGRGTTDAIFIIRQLQEKFLSRKDLNDKNLTLFCFVDLEKAFDRVPRKLLWWAIRKLGVEELIVRLAQAMYNNARSRVRVGSEYSEEFEVGVGIHQGPVLSPLLFIIVLEALSREFRVGCPGSCSLQIISCYFSRGMCWTCQGVEWGIGIQGSSCKHD